MPKEPLFCTFHPKKREVKVSERKSISFHEKWINYSFFDKKKGETDFLEKIKEWAKKHTEASMCTWYDFPSIFFYAEMAIRLVSV